MGAEDVFVVVHQGQWAVRFRGVIRSVRATQQDAIELGRALAQQQRCDLLVQDQDGQFRIHNSYGSDPFPPRG
jgi:hypothetical protein